MKRICSAVLSLALLCGTLALAACGGNGGTTTTAGTNAPANTLGTGVGTEAVTTQDPNYFPDVGDEAAGEKKPNGYENVDFNGKTFVFEAVLSNKDWNAYEICADEEATDALSNAITRRNDIMAELYDCSIEQITNAEGTLSNDFATDSCHVDVAACQYNANGKANGNYYNLAKYLDLSHPWWDQGYVNDVTVDGKLFTIIGDFSLTSFDATWVLFFNKEVLQQNDKIKNYNFYDLVDKNEWTIDTFYEVVQKAKQDDGDQVMTIGSGDIYGLVSSDFGIRGLYYGAGASYVTKTDDAAGTTTFTHGFNNQAALVAQKVIDIYADEAASIENYSKVGTQITNGLTLFAPETLDKARNWSEAGLENFGVIPHPAYSTEQIQTTGYKHNVDNHMIYYCVPTTLNYDLDLIWDFLELYGYHSRYIVYPEYLNVYKYTYTHSEEDARMIDIIMQSRTFDLGYQFNWGGADSELISGIKSGSNVVSQLGGSIGDVIITAAQDYKDTVGKVNN